MEASDNFAKSRQARYCQDHADLQNCPNDMVITLGNISTLHFIFNLLDFFSSQPNMSTKFHSFVVVIATADAFDLPLSLKNLEVVPSQPPSVKGKKRF